MSEQPTYRRKPEWLRKRLQATPARHEVKALLRELNLHTVCEEASCPNISECFGRRTATFMIGGDTCTRRCHYCDVATGRPEALDPFEPLHVARAAATLGLRHVVVTAVARDDLADGGAAHFAATIRAIRRQLPEARVEVLIPDFKGREADLQLVLDAGPHVLNHNIETVRRLFKGVRAQGNYDRSLQLLRRSSEAAPQSSTKSGLMVGLGETDEEVFATMRDLRGVGVELVTIGQYLQPSLRHLPVAEYLEPARYEAYREYGQQLGFQATFAGPFVRSSFHAGELYEQAATGDAAGAAQPWITLQQ